MKFLILLVLALMGCSATRQSAVNHPPVIETADRNFAVRDGTLTPQTFSIFLWPANLSHVQMQDLISRVSSKSQELDALEHKIRASRADKLKLQKQFQAQQCIARWARTVDQTDPGAEIQVVTEWQRIDPNHPENGISISRCQQNQDDRQALDRQIDELTSQAPDLIESLYQIVDPGSPQVVENSKAIDAIGSYLHLPADRKGRVKISLKDFLWAGHTQSSESVSPGQITVVNYDRDDQVLVFRVPELLADGRASGQDYLFNLNRIESEDDQLVIFQGEVTLNHEGQVLRHGLVRIEGTWK